MSGNGEASSPKTLDQIAQATWDEVLGDDEVIKSGTEFEEERPKVAPRETELEEETPPPEETPETPETTDQNAGEEQEQTAAQAPEHWSADDRTMFDKLDDEAKEFLLRRHRQMESDYTRKTQENAAAIKVGRLLDEAMDPAVRADLRRIGVDNESYIRQMMQWHHMSVVNPAEFARNVVRQLRLDPAQLFGEGWTEGQEDTDPQSQRMAAIEQRLNQDQNERYNQAVAETQAKVTAFKDEKDAAGNLLRPHFEEVRKDMAQFLRVDNSMSLQDAYEAAVFKNPTLRASFAKPAPAPQQQTPDQIARAKAALRAKQSNIKGGGGTVEQRQSDKGPLTLEQSLKAAADELGFEN